MPVYVDRACNHYRRMKMCHMIADTKQELHLTAYIIGVKRKWYQENASFPHYNICKAKRELAIKSGAIEVNRKELVLKMREIRANEQTS